MTIVNAALKYCHAGYSVIPVQKNKKPYIAWEKYQREKAGSDQIREWWEKWPAANVAIVTGSISDISVVDIDSEDAREQIEGHIPNSMITPVSRTPRGGWHYYFQASNGMGNAQGVITNVDYRGFGGYIIAPPSEGYRWMPNLSIDRVKPCQLPETIEKLLKKNYTEGRLNKPLAFTKGNRDDTIFHMALSMARGGMPQGEVAKAVLHFAQSCDPPFEEKEALIKVQSAFERLENKEQNLTQNIRDWVEGTKGEFLTRDVFEELNIPREQKQKVSTILSRLTDEKLIERTGRRTGCFRRIEKTLNKMNIFSTEEKLVDIKLPFGIDSMVNIMPGNVIIIAGAKDAGKTAFLLNIAANNLYKMTVHYFNSEMGESELQRRLKLFDDMEFEDWGEVNFYERDENFHDIIVPGEGNLNIIDYLEVYEDFWLVRKRIAEIWRKLQGAVAIVALQKPRGRDVAFGGEGSIEKARLALAMEGGELKIVSGKNWKTAENPKGKRIKYKVVAGCKFIETDDWSME